MCLWVRNKHPVCGHVLLTKEEISLLRCEMGKPADEKPNGCESQSYTVADKICDGREGCERERCVYNKKGPVWLCSRAHRGLHHCSMVRGDDLTKRRTSIRKIRERFIGERRSRPGSFCESRAALPRDCKMAAEAQPQIVVEVADQPPSPRRPSRALKPSAKAREAMQSLEDVATTSRRAASETTRAVTTRGARASGILYGANSRIETGKSGIQMLLEAINEQRDEMYRMITEQRNTIGELREVICKQHDAIQELHRQLADTRTQLSEELRQARDQIDTLQRHPVAMASSQPSARGSYAEVARTPPSSQPSGVRTLSSRNTTPSSFTDTLFCTIDTSRVEEKEKGNVQVADIRKAIETEARAQESMGDWRCAAVVKEARNPDRVRVICRDEGEVQLVKEAAVKISVPGVRVLRDQLYPVKAAEALGTENDVNIAKIAWLSRKDTSKAYGSMVVYVTKGSEARRLLDGRYFHLAGESAYTTVFALREGPIQCYRCQEIGHKAFACKKPQRCGRCAEQGHHHKTCQSVVLKCVLCRGPHESFSKNCRQSLLNDEGLKDFAVLAISEPYARLIEGSVTTVPMSHHNWTKLIPTTRRETTWPIRSMLWVRSDIEVEQIPVPSADLTAARIRLPDRAVLMVSVYVEGGSDEALEDAMREIDRLIRRFRNGTGTRTDIILAGDFNRHDQLWGGDDVSPRRQGEGDRIINLMDEHSLCSLLPRGTKTWQSGDIESTIDLVLASAELADQLLRCAIHPCDHGSDHRASRQLLTPRWRTVPQQTDRLMAAVTEAVYGLTPKAKPSPYAKRWWTTDLTRLRQTYTFWRNQARSRRRIGQTAPELEQRARMAAKEYHDAIRRQKSSHWNDFLADDANIWQATKYLQTGSGTMGDKIPPLVRPDGSITEGKAEQAQELLTAFFPPLPARIEDEGQRPQRAPVHMPDLTMEEIEQKVLSAKPWKAPGEDGLPANGMETALASGQRQGAPIYSGTSLRDGDIPSQWRNAKIIPLKKPGKSEYTLAKSWRPISLLSTLGKILEAVIAERLSHAVETCGLLPANHFGARKRRSTEQALLLLQEHIYKAWRARKVLSLISFDVKGAYNGVFKDRLLQRLKARGIPEPLVKWIDAFCSKRTATIAVNGFTSGRQELPQAGLPQGSPLSPVLFLFFNADLVQHKIDANGGAIAFVDDYTAWVTGPSAESNRTGIQGLDSKLSSTKPLTGRNGARFSEQPFSVKGEVVKPKESAKILGVVMDRELRYKQHIARTAAKGLAAALALKRLKILSPRTARQLFVATVAPVMDYAANVWMHACGEKALSWLNRAQKIGALAITGAFRTAATAVVEAEASIYPVRERHAQAAASLWINIHTLPGTHPLAMKKVRNTVRFVSPLQKIARVAEGVRVDRMETIQEYAVPPWVPRLRPTLEADRGKAAEMVNKISGIVIATSSSVKKGIVGMGGLARDILFNRTSETVTNYAVVLGTREEQNPYTAELAAIAMALEKLPASICHRHITVITRNQSALAAVGQPRQQSGQSIIRQIYDLARLHRQRGNSVNFLWIPAEIDFALGSDAKAAAQRASKQGRTPDSQIPQAKSTAMRLAMERQRATRVLPVSVGKFSKAMDAALPGKHTRHLYDKLKRREACVLAQLRTGMARLNGFLSRIGAVESDLCACGQARESVEHFLFRCVRWTALREDMLQCTVARRGSLSFYLGGKAPSDTRHWSPDMKAVRATIKYAMATGRLELNEEESLDQSQ
ncbi:hypothetical protein CHGG_05095 [Chaetomium globosum CBS 148.51]|uniref:Reverse transcriptase domain-containing protein n=1 Tax=Chaetomium globosum (strain ATCC 6205 / CBS 148.51 / DSM 1962 / NBRC 6347 / NRRL 1970) TaxID=306901 RepID=Q2GZF1_CHAGB|nr:uncharacterized protein CHGG_05095 [Chaetomium globosum CBS 148.51]EAQ88476.1 hypothetical protein CHGG_05095 [Chaetomium globosum CBS 148.51]